MMVKHSMEIFLKEAGVPDNAIGKVKSTILTWFAFGFLSGIACGLWLYLIIYR